jgi:dephospho-CoA kinase
MIIGLTGTMASGKDAVADILKKKGYVYFSLSDEVRAEAQAREIELTRENLQNLGNEMRKAEGSGVLAQRILMKITDPQKNYVINGIRNPAEIAELKNWPGFYLISVDAPQQLRFQRLMTRNRPSDPKVFYMFMKADNKDQGQGEEESGQQVGECMKLADVSIFNDFSLERLTDKVVFMVQQIQNKDAVLRDTRTIAERG